MATLDIVTGKEAAEYLRANGANEGPLLANWITAASLAVDDLCGPVVVRTLTAELHDGGMNTIMVDYRPVSSVTSVTEYDAAGTSTSLTAETVSSKPASAFLADLPTGIIWRRSSGTDTKFVAGRKNVSVTYVAGRAATTSAVSSRFKQATLALIAHLWRVEHGTGNTFGDPSDTFTPSGFAVPRRVVEILGSEVHPRIAVA